MRKQYLLLFFVQTFIVWVAGAQLPYYDPQPSKYYQRVLSPLKPVQDSALVSMTALVEDVNISTNYFNGLGQPIQSVQRQASPTKKDYIVPVLYDEFGRITKQYPVFSQATANFNDGKFKTSALVNDSIFYKSLFPGEQVINSSKVYDASPMQRVLKVTAPGNSWGASARGVSYAERANAISDSVRFWTINIITEDDVATTTLTYLPGTLIVLETTDEQGVKTLVYKDEQGKTILTKTQVSTTPATGHSGWLCTYYVYDETGQLRMVLPPKAVQALQAVSWNLAANLSISTGLCYSYFYDNRGRAVMKRIPGKDKTYIAYDLLDRVVMTQDARLRQTGQWAFVKYDGQSRPVKSGLIFSGLSKDDIFSQAAANSDYPALTGTYTITTETFYDDYAWVASSGVSFTSSLVTTNINSTNFYTDYNAFPQYAQPVTESKRIRGAVTGVKKGIIGSTDYLYSLSIYDERGRVIQVKESNNTGGTDVVTQQYSFSNRVLRTHLQHAKGGTNAQTHTVLTKYNYDHAGRLLNIVKNLDGLGDKTIVQNSFNELGQLVNKAMGSGVESQELAYNIRGWLNSINRQFVTSAGSTTNYFGEILSYDTSASTADLFNGPISGVQWKGQGDGIARRYGFTYDIANRLTSAAFTQQNQGTTSWTSDKVDFSVTGLAYDAGSNILSMLQRGLEIGSSATIDSLTYSYFTNSNQLQKVSDGISGGSNLGDFKDTLLSADDYTYDVNGNITKDINRKMHTPAGAAGAVYNVLDRPDSMVIAGKQTLYYTYDVSGMKLGKKINDYSSGTLVTKTYSYIAGFVYLNDTLQYALHEEGRIRWAQKRNFTTGALYRAFEWDYFIRDHLGNVRTVLTEGRDTTGYQATMELARQPVEQPLFANIYDPVNTVVTKPGGFDSDGANEKVSRLSAASGVNKKTGPSIVLKVMAGDKVQVNTFAFYNTPVQPPPAGPSLISSLIAALSSGVVSNAPGKLVTADVSALEGVITPGVEDFLDDRTYDAAKPKAYLNWILFDNQFQYVASNSGVQQVAAGASKQALVAPLQTIAKNGYLYVYVSNESPQDVYFDDLTVKHITGAMVQEQAYYPFGLTMAGISDKAFNKLSTDYKYNGGVELEEETNLYNTFFRHYDPQLGRFNGVDILSQQSSGLSPYQFGLNNPILFNDPLGDRAVTMGDIERMWNNPNGGNWSETAGVRLFGSQDEAFGFGAMLMAQNGMWGGGSGWAGSFGEALGKYNGGNITSSMAAGYYKATWSGQASNISAMTVSGGFNLSFTATSSGNSYSGYLVSEANIRESFDFLASLYGIGSSVLQAGFGFSEFTASTELAVAALRPSYQAAASMAKHGVHDVPFWLKKNIFASPLTRNNNAIPLGRISPGAARNGAAILKYAAPGLTILAVGTTAYDILKDGKISVGEGFQGVNTALQIIFPVYGVSYGLVDLGFSVFTDRSLTDRIKTGIDSY